MLLYIISHFFNWKNWFNLGIKKSNRIKLNLVLFWRFWKIIVMKKKIQESNNLLENSSMNKKMEVWSSNLYFVVVHNIFCLYLNIQYAIFFISSKKEPQPIFRTGLNRTRIKQQMNSLKIVFWYKALRNFISWKIV